MHTKMHTKTTKPLQRKGKGILNTRVRLPSAAPNPDSFGFKGFGVFSLRRNGFEGFMMTFKGIAIPFK